MSIINTASSEKIRYFAEQMLGQSFGTAQDAWRAWLQTETSSAGSLYDLEMRWLGSQGRTGSLYDRWRQECIAGGYTQLFPEAINNYLDNPVTSSGGIDEYTVLMLHMDGADASTTFTDSSLTPKTVTRGGNAQIDTAQSVFGGASGLFDGVGDFLSVPDSADFNFGSGEMTIDFRVRMAATTSSVCWGHGTNSEHFAKLWWDAANSRWQLIVVNTNVTVVNITNSTAASTNTWYHIAAVRSGNVWTLYVDGVGGTPQTAAITYPEYTSAVGIGTWYYDGIDREQSLNGWLDELRISKGIARWTANFTPPTEAYAE